MKIRQRLRTRVFEATINLALIAVLCVFGNQYIVRRILPARYFKVKFFAVLDVSFNDFLLRLLLLSVC